MRDSPDQIEREELNSKGMFYYLHPSPSQHTLNFNQHTLTPQQFQLLYQTLSKIQRMPSKKTKPLVNQTFPQ